MVSLGRRHTWRRMGVSPLTGPTGSRGGQGWSVVSKKDGELVGNCSLRACCQYVERWLDEGNRQSREINNSKSFEDEKTRSVRLSEAAREVLRHTTRASCPEFCAKALLNELHSGGRTVLTRFISILT